MTDTPPEQFVTVVSVGSKRDPNEEEEAVEHANANIPGFVTVLTIGDGEKDKKLVKDVTEEVIVYRLPGERLGFGLKFEGGTKANEFVERLFIQSCAANSPASHVKSSWGKLTEGDEVLEIDLVPVKTMTRVDCVRSLKDSNVAIRLLVRHVFEQQQSKINTEKTSCIDDKRTPPPPPPVPPRKIPKKAISKNDQGNCNEQSENIPKKPPPRYYSPDVSRRRAFDGNFDPPDAEVYIDLFLHESNQCLSESDDTGSTISTVIDRFSSIPNTTTSSFSGSLPSTPTAKQRCIDTTNMNISEDEDVRFMFLNREENNNIISKDNPLCFQDAPLSYGNESTKIIALDGLEETSLQERNEQCLTESPPVPSRSKDVNSLVETLQDMNLPRLVDFVPKSNGIKETNENSTELIKLFLEDEQCKSNYDENRNIDVIDDYNDEVDLFAPKWNMSSQLTTIGEVEEETSGTDLKQYNRPNSTPVVIVENADVCNENGKLFEQRQTPKEVPQADGIMASSLSDLRQPPDGDEFPDFAENNERKCPENYFASSVPEKTAATENELTNFAKFNHHQPDPTRLLHTRSQSLIDMSVISKEKNSRWNQMVEQRRRGLSKLKGLVIPESTENDVTPVNIPEIKSINTAMLIPLPKIETSVPPTLPVLEISKSPTLLLSPLVTSINDPPKYSPAFKRKSLQIYPTNVNNNKDNNGENSASKCSETSPSPPRPNRSTDDDLNPPKSLESISSPTRSDCSFDYTKKFNKENESSPKIRYDRKLEDESDNDSAVSSSQSSYNSKFSPPSSPTKSLDENYNKDDDKQSQNRFLKESSVEAINRKNILASAKCRSGKDLKVGSPVIRRKKETKEPAAVAQSVVASDSSSENKSHPEEDKSDVKVWESVDDDPVTDQTESNHAEVKEELKSANEISEKEPSVPIPLPRSSSSSTSNHLPPPAKVLEDVNQRRYTSNVFGRKSNPVSVKMLTKNFENAGNSASPPPRPSGASQKVPVYKTQSSRSVKVEILKTEAKLSNIERRAGKPELKPKPKPKDLQFLKIDNQKLNNDENNKSRSASETVVLRLETVGSNLGITLAGGIDEDKEITVHRIRYGSVAYNDGRIKRGDKIISINGISTRGLTHIEAVDLLKKPTNEFTIVIQEGIETVPSTPSSLSSRRSSSLSILSDIKSVPAAEVSAKEANKVISIFKDGSSLGFSIEGGKESPQGDKPLVVKKIFTGGAANKQGELNINDELLIINNINFRNLTRIEAWNMMKKIPDGPVEIHIYRKC